MEKVLDSERAPQQGKYLTTDLGALKGDSLAGIKLIADVAIASVQSGKNGKVYKNSLS